MVRPHLPLNALRAFEASARHLSFTRAAIELCVTQAAISHQVKGLETRLGVRLFRRLPRGLALTDEGLALQPALAESFDRIAELVEGIASGEATQLLSVAAVGTFATGWLLPRLPGFRAANPRIDLRLFTNNNRVDLAGEGLDYAIRFGDGAWHATEAVPLIEAPLTPLCTPALARGLAEPRDLLGLPLLRSYRADEWARWFDAAGVPPPTLKGPVFDSSLAMAEAALQGAGVALAPASMLGRPLDDGALVRPFAIEVSTGRYWLTWLKSRALSPAMLAFRDWIAGA
ncbi:LysR family transcriptional regulator of beta-lactamase [Sphingomonas naasensis]|uniref:LysR family transcriptional regulator n=1 Tax=Sphingomonas naasensis TaxID=1344951 RepID=A0A4S1WRJ7_9SPHN|nr:LysR family transcriptional regulator [Sphingomonas naasensis]NIJ18760.1 LysR family transcriptional regulator of beta-lactamase [Sphingomonas naasensis]TGX45994.1 LysR family transcriptional regulator [Sphingomonas naasensis]